MHSSFLRGWGLIACLAMSLATPCVFGQGGSPGYSPTAEDFEFPLQDLDEMKGEVIWLQGGLKRGDTTPYQNPRIPLASYEQGLLDRDGNLWTFLDTPKGRELRYNKQLRGKEVEVKGWLYDKTQIIEVYAWKDSQAHPVRVDGAYPEPIKVPFDSSRAETIEPIPPVTPDIPSKGMIGEDMWKQKEGLDLLEGSEVAPPTLPESGEEADLLRRFLEDEEGVGIQQSVPEAPVEENSGPDTIDLRQGARTEMESSLPSLPRSDPQTSVEDRSNPSRIEEGITDPEKIFEESRRALLEQ